MTISIKLCDCREGDILATDIFNREGIKLVSYNTMVNPFILEKLTEMGIEEVVVYDPPINTSTKEYKLKCLDNSYKENVVTVKSIVHELARGKALDIGKITNSADDIYKHLCDNSNDNIIKYLYKIKGTDEYTYQHSVNVAFYSMLLARWLNFSEDEIKEAVQAGLLHDIGKSKVPLRILNKSSQLTKEEFTIIKKHPVYGYSILDESNFVNIDIKRAVLLHHERVNKTGYPFSISADGIGILTRIVSVADVYDAMTSNRVYKKKATPFAAFEMFLTDGYTNFDSYVANKFVNNMATYLTGSDVMLNNGETGKIVYLPPHDILNPIVCSNGEYLSINENGLKITDLL